MTKTMGYLVACQGRTLFMREKEDCSWAYLDDEYTVTELVAKNDDHVIDDTAERLQILEEIYELEEKEISLLKGRLEEAVELVESIHLFSMNQTTNIMEARGLLKLIAEACNKWLSPKE